jgi:uroporphyrinogen decarboxylase
MKPVTGRILSSPGRLAIPVLTFPGGQITGSTVREMVHDPGKQVAAQLALRDRFRTSALLSAMDLSAEAEEFGSTIRFEDHEIPAVLGRLVTDLPSAEALRIPHVGGKRTRVYLETIRLLARERGDSLLLAGCIGPFSLAGRLFGVSEALLATAMEPETMELLVEKATAFLTSYIREFKNAGADGVIIAEPTAGLISPGAVLQFSSPYVRQIIEATEDERFQIILHNCGAKIGHLSAKLASGASAYHFGKPMDLPAALAKVDPGMIICGNLDPAEVFVNSTAGEVASRTEALLQATAGATNFVISSGCDLPAQVPLAHLDAFFDAVSRFNGH